MSRDALLAAVAAHPEEDAPRLVLADWLDEFGDDLDRTHAELIRTQIALERLPPGDDAWAELSTREYDLTSGNWNLRNRVANQDGVGAKFSRGFPDRVGFDWNDKRKGRLTADDLALLAAAIARLPIRTFAGDVLGCGPDPLPQPGRSGLELLAGWSPLARLTGLELSGDFTPYEERGDYRSGLRALGASPFARGLRRLKVSGWQLDPEAFVDVVLSDNLMRLNDLDFGCHNYPAVAECVRMVGHSAIAAGLSRLSAPWIDVSATTVRMCLERGLLRSLAFGVAEDARSHARPAGGVGPLLGRHRLVGLRELTITGEEHGFQTDESPSGMADCRDIPHLTELLASPLLDKLETLRLNGVALGDEGLRLLAESPVGRSLIELDVQQCGLTGLGAVRPLLAEGRLRRLAIDHNPIEEAAAHDMASWPEFGRLHRINAGFFNFLEDEGRDALENSPHRHPWLKVW